MSEIPIPEEAAREAGVPSSESPQNETEKNDSIEKLFENFRASEEYAEGLEKHRQGIKPGTHQEIAVRGYEAQMTTPEEPRVGLGEHYKEAFMRYVERYYDETGVWPLYFSTESQSEKVGEVYRDYGEKARRVWASIGKVSAVKQTEIDKERSEVHDRLAEVLYQEGKVKTFLDAKLVARLWLVADGVESPAAITFMDKARIQRDFAHLRNVEGGGE